jgi:hypothetical protein
MSLGIDEDRAKFFASFFKDFFGVSLMSRGVGEELQEWACSVSMQASPERNARKCKVVCDHGFPRRSGRVQGPDVDHPRY